MPEGQWSDRVGEYENNKLIGGDGMLIPILVSLALAALALVALRLSWLRIRGRRRVRATVVSVSVGSTKAGNGFGISPIFEYVNDRGQVVRASSVQHDRHALMPKLGDEVDIFIDLTRPQYASLQRPRNQWLAPLALACLAGLFFLLGLGGR